MWEAFDIDKFQLEEEFISFSSDSQEDQIASLAIDKIEDRRDFTNSSVTEKASILSVRENEREDGIVFSESKYEFSDKSEDIAKEPEQKIRTTKNKDEKEEKNTKNT